MSSSAFKPEIYRSLIHPAMSISIATTGVLASIWLVAVNVGIAAPRVGTIVVVILAPILEAVAGNALYKERAGIANRVRELLIYLSVLYIVFSIFKGGPFFERFLPSFAQMIPVLCAALAWLVAFVFHNRLRGRESLLRSFHGLHGAELRRAVLERQHDMALTVRQLRKARGLIGGLFVVLSLFAVFATFNFFGIGVLRAGSGAFVLLVLYGISSIACIGSLNAFIEEYAANGEGLTVPLRFQRRRSLMAAIMIVLVLVLAFALSRAQALLPVEAIADFFRWFAGLFERDVEPQPEPPPIRQAPPQEAPPSIVEMLQEMETSEPPLWLRIIARMVKRLAVTTLIVGGIVLVFGPLFSPAFRKALKQLKPRQFFAELFRNLKRRLRVLKRLLKRGLRWRRRKDELREESDAQSPDAWREKAWKPSLRKRRQMDRVVQVFVDITRWGERHGVSYHRTEATREYLSRIATLRPERYADAVFVADTFCEARFSRHLVPRARMHEYAQAAKRITSGE